MHKCENEMIFPLYKCVENRTGRAKVGAREVDTKKCSICKHIRCVDWQQFSVCALVIFSKAMALATATDLRGTQDKLLNPFSVELS